MNLVVNPTQLSSLLAITIPAREPILIKGKPGVGKTDIVTAAALAANADIIVSHPAVSDPTDYKGLPHHAGEGRAEFLPFGDLDRLVHANKLTVNFIDDLGQAPNSVQAAVMQLILARQVNGTRISDDVVFVAATNSRSDRAGVQGLLEPVKSRFAAIVELATDLDGWTNWALDHDVKPELVAFLRLNPDCLHKFAPTQDIVNSPSPRTWANANRLLKLNLPGSIRLQALAGAVGEAEATMFVGFLEVFEKAPNPDDILMDPEGAPIPSDDEPSIMYAVATALGYRANVKNCGAVIRYAQRLYDAKKPEFATYLVRDAVRRDKGILTTPAFMKFATSEMAKAIFAAHS